MKRLSLLTNPKSMEKCMQSLIKGVFILSTLIAIGLISAVPAARALTFAI
jgi:hypothetical protein